MSNDFTISKRGNALVGITGSKIYLTEIPPYVTQTCALNLSFGNISSYDQLGAMELIYIILTLEPPLIERKLLESLYRM